MVEGVERLGLVPGFSIGKRKLGVAHREIALPAGMKSGEGKGAEPAARLRVELWGAKGRRPRHVEIDEQGAGQASKG